MSQKKEPTLAEQAFEQAPPSRGRTGWLTRITEEQYQELVALRKAKRDGQLPGWTNHALYTHIVVPRLWPEHEGKRPVSLPTFNRWMDCNE